MTEGNQTLTGDLSTSFSFKSLSNQEAIQWITGFAGVGILIVVLNLATIFTFAKNSHLRRRSVYCLINLAAADMMYGGFGSAEWFCYFSQYLSNSAFDFNVFLGLNIVAILSLIASVMSLAVVSMERVFATFFPFRHRASGLTMYTGTFAVVWVLALIVSLLCNLVPRTRPEFKGAVTLYWIFLLASVAVILLSYLSIFIKVKYHDRQQNCLQRLQQFSIQVQRQRRERNLAITLFIMTIISLLTWLPYLSVRVLYLQYSIYEILRICPNTFALVLLIQFTNSLINPCVYLIRMKDFRKELFSLLCPCKRDGRNQISHFSH